MEEIEARVTDKSRLRGVFTRREQVVEFLEDIKEKDPGSLGDNQRTSG